MATIFSCLTIDQPKHIATQHDILLKNQFSRGCLVASSGHNKRVKIKYWGQIPNLTSLLTPPFSLNTVQCRSPPFIKPVFLILITTWYFLPWLCVCSIFLTWGIYIKMYEALSYTVQTEPKRVWSDRNTKHRNMCTYTNRRAKYPHWKSV